MPDGFEDVRTFAQRIKQTYPDYSSVDDYELVSRIATKYPDYKSRIKGFDIQGADELKLSPAMTGHYLRLYEQFEKAGVKPFIKKLGGFRTAEDENYLFRTGHPTMGNTGYGDKISPHQEGRAIDFSFSPEQKAKGRQIMAEYARQYGLHIPGVTSPSKTPEPWHIALPKGQDLFAFNTEVDEPQQPGRVPEPPIVLRHKGAEMFQLTPKEKARLGVPIFEGASVQGEAASNADEPIRAAVKQTAPPGYSYLPESAQEWFAGMVAKSASGLSKLGAGIIRAVPHDPLSGNAATTGALASKLNDIANEISTGALVMDKKARRGFLSQTAQDVMAGTVASAPAMGLVALGVPPPIAFGLQSYLETTADPDASLKNILLQTGKGATIGALFELPVPVKLNILGRIGFKAGTVGAGTFAVEKVTGADTKNAATSALVNSIFAASSARRGGVPERPVTEPRIDMMPDIPDVPVSTISEPRVIKQPASEPNQLAQPATTELPSVSPQREAATTSQDATTASTSEGGGVGMDKFLERLEAKLVEKGVNDPALRKQVLNEVAQHGKLKALLGEDDVTQHIRKVFDEPAKTQEGTRIVAYDLTLPGQPPQRATLAIKDGVADVSVGPPRGQFMVELDEGNYQVPRAELGARTVLAVKRFLQREHPEITEFKFARGGSTGGEYGRERTLTTKPTTGSTSPESGMSDSRAAGLGRQSNSASSVLLDSRIGSDTALFSTARDLLKATPRAALETLINQDLTQWRDLSTTEAQYRRALDATAAKHPEATNKLAHLQAAFMDRGDATPYQNVSDVAREFLGTSERRVAAPKVEGGVSVPQAMTRDEVGDAARERAMNDPSIPPAPPDMYHTLAALEDRSNRKGYDPAMLTPERIARAVDAGFITKNKQPKLTETGRNQKYDWTIDARRRDEAIGNLSDQMSDNAVARWDRENDPNSWEARNAANALVPDTKLRNERGDVIPVYHGSRSPVDRLEVQSGEARMVEGIYFSKDRAEAEKYTKYEGRKQPENVRGYYLDLRNPYVRTEVNHQELYSIGGKLSETNGRQRTEALKKLGYDGLIDETMNEVVAFDANQVKPITSQEPIISTPQEAPKGEVTTKPVEAAGFGMAPVAQEIIDTVQRSAENARQQVSNVRQGKIEGNAETVLFDFQGKTYKGTLKGRNRDLVVGFDPEADKAIALRTLLDGHVEVVGKAKTSPVEAPKTAEPLAAVIEQRASQFAALREGATTGERHALDLTDDLKSGLDRVSVLKQQGVNVLDTINADESLTPFQRQVTHLLDHDPEIVGKVLDNYLKSAELIGSPQEKAFFEKNPPTKDALLEAAMREAVRDANKEISVSESEGLRPQPETSGSVPNIDTASKPASEGVPQPNRSIEAGSTPEAVEGGNVLRLSLAPGVPEFIQQDVLPTAKSFGLGVVETLKGVAKLLSPRSFAPKEGVDILMKMKGNRDQAEFLFQKSMEEVKANFEQMPKADLVAFMDRYKRGMPQATPELQAVADSYKILNDEVYDELKKWKPSIPYLEDHFRVFWKVIPGAPESKGFGGIFRRPLQGTRGMLKQHTLADVSEGIARGGEPVSYNPQVLQELGYADSLKFITAQRMWQAGKDAGLVKFFRNSERGKIPSDYAQIKDPIAKVYFPTEEGALASLGEWRAQEDFARLINNHLSRDYIREAAAGRGAMWLKNQMTMVELGLSAFHAVFETNEAASSALAQGMRRIWNLGVLQGQPKEALKGLGEMARFPLAPAETARAGGSAIEYLTNKDEFLKSTRGQSFIKQFPEASQMLDDLFTGGGQVGMSEAYRTNTTRAFKEAIANGNYPGALLRALPAFNEQVMKPLFQVYIPRLKVGQFLKEYQLMLQEYKPDLESGRLTRPELARKTWDFVEDRYGEMNFDNLFWDRTFKTSAQLLFRSVTWQLGNLRASFGALPEQAAEIGRSVRAGQVPRLTPKMSWFVGQALVTATLGAIITKAFTGNWPETLSDYVYPRTDKDDPTQRLSIPTYIRVLTGLIKKPTEAIPHAASSEISRSMEVWRNRDYYGVQVWNPDDPLYKKAPEMLGHFMPMPFSITSFLKSTEQGQPIWKSAASFAGFTKAPAYAYQTPAEERISELLQRKYGSEVKTQRQADRGTLMRDIRMALREKNTERATALIRQGQAAGQLTTSDLMQITKSSGQSPLVLSFESLAKETDSYDGLSTMLDVYENYMNDDERKKVRPVLARKQLALIGLNSVGRGMKPTELRATPAEQEALKLRLNKALGVSGVPSPPQ